MIKHIAGYFAIILSLSACYILPDTAQVATHPSITIASITPDLTPRIMVTATASDPIATPDAFPDGVYDALPASMGICFESAWDAAGQIFVIRSAEEHIQFYNLADNANLCRRPVERVPFDFSGGDVLVGIWNRGAGCTAQHEITAYERDDSALTIHIEAQFSTEGDCPYDLVRGLWLGIDDAQSHTINLTVTE